jgi:hypothetical protein
MAHGINKFPKTLEDASQVLSAHRVDNFGKKKAHQANPSNGNGNRAQDQQQAPATEEVPALSFIQMEGRCYCCGNKGHMADKCPRKDKIPKTEWAISKAKNLEAQSHVTAPVASQPPSVVTMPHSATPSVAGWIGVQTHHAFSGYDTKEDMKAAIGVDTMSTCSIFGNGDFLTNIRFVDVPLELGTNAGNLHVRMQGDLKGFGPVWYHPEAIANILAFHEMKNKFEIIWDQAGDRFIICAGTPTEFKCCGNGLYVYQVPPNEFKLNHFSAPQCAQVPPKVAMGSVEENKLLFTPRQIE